MDWINLPMCLSYCVAVKKTLWESIQLGTCLQVQSFSPSSSWREAWQKALCWSRSWELLLIHRQREYGWLWHGLLNLKAYPNVTLLPTRSHLLILLTPSDSPESLLSKESNIWTYRGHFYSNHHTTPSLLTLAPLDKILVKWLCRQWELKKRIRLALLSWFVF